MPRPLFQRTEVGEQGEGASSGETGNCAAEEGHARRVEEHVPVQLEDRSEDIQHLLYPQDEQQRQSTFAVENQSSDPVMQHSSASAENQWSFAEQQAAATADPYSSGVTEYLSSATSELHSFTSLEFQQQSASPEQQPTEDFPSNSSDYHSDESTEDHLSRSGHNPSTASSNPVHPLSANRQLTDYNPSALMGRHPSESSQLHSLTSAEQQLSRTAGHTTPAESTSSSSAQGQCSSMAQGSLASTDHLPSSPVHQASGSAEHQASSSGEELHPVPSEEQQQPTSSTAGQQARLPVEQSSLGQGELCVSGDHSDAKSRGRNDDMPDSRTRSDSDVSELSQPRERGSSCSSCVKCEAAGLMLLPESLELWTSVPGPCCNKMYCDLLKALKERFTRDKCLQNKPALNLLKHVLDVPLSDDVSEVSLQNFLYAERLFGPLTFSNGRCAFLTNVEKLATKSRSRRTPSWFAGRMDSETAENYLDRKRKGTFLVRLSSTSPACEGSYAISVVAETQAWGRSVEHFMVQGNPEATKADPSSLHLTFQGQEFCSLIEAVDHARKTGVRMEDQGRVTFTDICPRLPLHSALTPYR